MSGSGTKCCYCGFGPRVTASVKLLSEPPHPPRVPPHPPPFHFGSYFPVTSARIPFIFNTIETGLLSPGLPQTLLPLKLVPHTYLEKPMVHKETLLRLCCGENIVMCQEFWVSRLISISLFKMSIKL